MRASESLNWDDASFVRPRKNDAKLAGRCNSTAIKRGAIVAGRTAKNEVKLLANCWTFVCK